jgi:hypothetical protein
VFERYNMTDNKLFVLYMIYRFHLPLEREELIQTALKEGWMNYFDLQQSLVELSEQGLIGTENLIQLTDQGMEVLNYFYTRVLFSKREMIGRYVETNRAKLVTQSQASAELTEGPLGVTVRLTMRDGEVTLLQLTMEELTMDKARRMADRWKSAPLEVYHELIQMLAGE